MIPFRILPRFLKFMFTPLESPAIHGGDDKNKVVIPYRKGGVKAPSFLTGFTPLETIIKKQLVRRFLIVVVFGLFFGVVICPSEVFSREVDLSKAILSVKKDIEQVTEELNQQRSRIAAARKPLAGEIQTLESELAILRREASALRKLMWQKETGFNVLKQEAQFLQQEVQFVSSLLLEYRREMGIRAGAAENQGLLEELKEIDELFQSEDEASSSLKAIKPLLALVDKRSWRNLGGSVFGGDCLDEKGIVHQGKFVLAGPITYFVAKDNSIAGLVGTRPGSAQASVISNIGVKQIKKLSEGKETVIPVDFTLGEALKLEGFKKSWFEHIKAGGIVMVPILLLGLLCIVLVIWKFLSLKKLRINIGPALGEILRLLYQGKIDEAKRKAESLGKPLAPVLLEGIDHKDAPKEHIEEIMHERILTEIPLLEKHLPTLAVCASAAPLLGLLGTVTGMIHTFNLVTIFGTGEARLLSGGISEALITTEYGLMIAIPTLLAHAYLSRRVRKIINMLEQTAIGFINGLKLRRARV